MERVNINLQSGLRQIMGMSIELNESKKGKVISYNKETGEAIVVVEERDQQFSDSKQINS